MSQMKVRVHLLALDGRTLCDVRDSSKAADAQWGGPPCGACVLAAEELMAAAKALIWRYGQPDQSPGEAAGVLASTRWPSRIDINLLLQEVGGRNATYTYPSFQDGPAAQKEERS